MQTARRSLLHLEDGPPHTKNWRFVNLELVAKYQILTISSVLDLSYWS